MTPQPLWAILCRLPEKGRRELEEIVNEMKERDSGEGGKRMKVKKQVKTFPLYLHLLQWVQALPICKPISVGHPGVARYTIPLPHPTTPPHRPNQILQNVASELGLYCLLRSVYPNTEL